MSDKDKDNPMEEIQKQLQQFLNNPNVKLGFPGMSNEVKDDDVEPTPEPKETQTKEEGVLDGIRRFNLKPKEIRDYLNRYVVKQEEAKKVLSVAICDHYNHVKQCLDNPKQLEDPYSKQNILLLGPTGVGKTYLMRMIAKMIGVPFVKADATKFSETGYVGSDVEDLVRDLVKVADGNLELAEYGIIYIDEIDKIATSGQEGGRDVSGRGVQVNLLKLMEESEVNLFSPTDMMSQMQAMMDFSRGGKREKKRTISTRHILFIVSGAFDQMAESVRKRLDKSRIGFTASAASDEVDTYAYLKQVEATDLIKYGFEPEIIGRLPVRVACESLNAADLAEILTASKGSILKQYQSDFKGYGIQFDMTKEAIRAIAQRAAGEKTGARGLMTVLERVFRDFKFELPSTAIETFEVTADTVEHPEQSLKQLLEANIHLREGVLIADLERFLSAFEAEHGFALEFDDAARKQLILESIELDMTIRSLCEAKFVDFEHGLKIINRNTGQQRFAIDSKTLRFPDKSLSEWVVDSFKDKERPEASPDA